MESIIQSLRKKGKYVFLSSVVIIVQLFFYAVLIERGILPPDSKSLLVVIAMIVGCFLGSMLTVRNCGEPVQGFIFAAVLLMLLFIVSFFICGLGCINSAMIKMVIAIFSGTIIGNLIGRQQYYRLRNSRKRKK